MVDDLQLALRAATVALNLATAFALGAASAALPLSASAAPWAVRQCGRARLASLAGLTAAMLASASLLLFEAAAIAEVPVGQAGAAVWSMLTATHLGTAWLIGFCALAVSLAAAAGRQGGRRQAGRRQAGRRQWPPLLGLLGLTVFMYTRSMVSHAAAEGDFSLAMLADWLHLAMISLWVGEVVVAGAVILASPVGADAGDGQAAARYVASLSATASFALAAIVATGVFSAWRNLGNLGNIGNIGNLGNLAGDPYGNTLLIKVGLVGVAALMGGANRFIVMPALLDGLRGGDPAGAQAHVRRFTMILRLETAVLLCVLAMAALLSSTPPPGAA